MESLPSRNFVRCVMEHLRSVEVSTRQHTDCITYLLVVTDQRCHKTRLFLLHVKRNTVHWPSKHASYTIDFCFSQMERSTGRAKQLDTISFPRWCHMSWIWWFWWDFIPGLSHKTCFCTTGTRKFITRMLKRSTGRAKQLDTISFPRWCHMNLMVLVGLHPRSLT